MGSDWFLQTPSLTSLPGSCFVTRLLISSTETRITLGFITCISQVPHIGMHTQSPQFINTDVTDPVGCCLFLTLDNWHIVIQVVSKTSGQLFTSPAVKQLAVLCPQLPSASYRKKSRLSPGMSSLCCVEIYWKQTCSACSDLFPPYCSPRLLWFPPFMQPHTILPLFFPLTQLLPLLFIYLLAASPGSLSLHKCPASFF